MATITTGLDSLVQNLFSFYTENLKNTNTDKELMRACREEITNADYDIWGRKTLENGNIEITFSSIIEISQHQSKSGHTESIEIEKIEVWTVDENGESYEMILDQYM